MLNMLRFRFLGLVTLLVLLTGCTNNLRPNNQDKLIVKYNCYDTFKDMEDHLLIMNSINPEDEINYFDFHMDHYLTKYYIAGIDYKSSNVAYQNENGIISDNLKTREIYYELHNTNTNLIATVVFKKDILFNASDIRLQDRKLGFHGTVLNYERNAFGDDFYLTYVDSYLLALKFNCNNVDIKIVEDFQNKLLEYFL